MSRIGTILHDHGGTVVITGIRIQVIILIMAILIIGHLYLSMAAMPITDVITTITMATDTHMVITTIINDVILTAEGPQLFGHAL